MLPYRKKNQIANGQNFMPDPNTDLRAWVMGIFSGAFTAEVSSLGSSSPFSKASISFTVG